MTDNSESIDFDKTVRLDGRGIVILGAGGGGIGTGITRMLAAGGARLLCVDNIEEEAVRIAAEVGGEAFVADISDRVQVERIFGRAVELFGDDFYGFVDVVGPELHGRIEDHDDDAIDKMLNLNLRHAVYAAQVAGPILADKGTGGSMVFISSLAGDIVSPGHSLYGTGKAALNHFMRYCADEYGPYGVRANSIGTGLILYPKMAAAVDAEAMKNVVEGVPLRRVGRPQDIAGAVYFLMSDLSAYVTGTLLHVEGGNMVGSRGIHHHGMGRKIDQSA